MARRRGWPQYKEAQRVSSVLVYSNILPCLLCNPSSAYLRLVDKNHDLPCYVLSRDGSERDGWRERQRGPIAGFVAGAQD